MSPRPASWIALAILISFPLGANILYSGFYDSLLTRIFIYAIIVVGFDLLAGYTGMISYGHALFFGTGAHLTGMILKHWTSWFWPPTVLTIFASALVAYLVGFLCIRTREIYFVFLTFAFSQFFFVTANSWSFVGAFNGLSGVPKPIIFPGMNLFGNNAFYYFALAVLMVAYLLARRITQSAFGRVMVDIRENEERTKFLGFNTHRIIIRIFVVSGIYGGVAGALLAAFNSFVSPNLYHPAVSGEIIMMALLGGYGYVVGGGDRVRSSHRSRESSFQLAGGIVDDDPGRHLCHPYSLQPWWNHGPSAEEWTEKGKKGRVMAIFELRRVGKSFGALEVLSEIDLDIEEGKITSVIGPNGAGKTTLFNVLCSLFPASTGSIFYKKRDITRRRSYEITLAGLARSFQITNIYRKLTVGENIFLAVQAPGQKANEPFYPVSEFGGCSA